MDSNPAQGRRSPSPEEPRFAPTTTVVLAERDPALRLGLRRSLKADARISVVAVTGTASSAVQVALERAVRVLVFGSSLRPHDVLAALETLREHAATTRCLVLMASHDEEEWHRALMAGAVGVLPSEGPHMRLPDAVHALNEDQAVVPPRLLVLLLRRFRSASSSRRARQPAQAPLSSREWQVLNELAAGRSTAATAERLGIALATVHSHLRNIYGKLGVNSRNEALAAAEYLRSQRPQSLLWRGASSGG